MAPHWTELMNLLSILIYLSKDRSPDGVELYSTLPDAHRRSRNTTSLMKTIQRMKPGGVTDISFRLGKILQEYQEKFYRSRFGSLLPRRPNRMNVYVLTNGLGHSDRLAIHIRDLTYKLQELDLPSDQVGIQFISFGTDPHGLHRLNEVNKDLDIWMYVNNSSFCNRS